MKNIFSMLLVSLHISATSFAATPAYNYAHATASDIPAMMDMYEQTTDADRTNIVVFPIEVRKACLTNSLKKLFVAQSDAETIGLTKFYHLHGDDITDTLAGELCCINEDFTPIAPNCSASFIYTHDELTAQKTPQCTAYHPDDLYFYKGADLTLATHRGHGVNSELTRFAYQQYAHPIILDAVASSDSVNVHFVYGLTHDNQGGLAERAENGILAGRTHGIAKLIAQSICATTAKDSIAFNIARFTAKKPEFEMHDGELRPVFPAESNGDGFVLSFELSC